MSETNINQPSIILKTSFVVSIVFALSLGILYSFYSHNSFNFFLYVTYIFFVNNFIIPVSVATIFCFYINNRDKTKPMNFIRKLKTIGVLSIVTLVMLFLWNSVDFLFHYHQNKELSTEYLMQGLQEEFVLGLYLAIPISAAVVFTYNIFNKSNSSLLIC